MGASDKSDRAGRDKPQAPAGLGHTATIPCAEWVILTDHNAAIRFDVRAYHLEFKVFGASAGQYLDSDDGWSEPAWELFDGIQTWPLELWESAEWELDGSIKWDGCIDWQTNPDCMAHGCGPQYASWVADLFAALFAYARRHFDLLGDEAPDMPSPVIQMAA